LVNRRSRYRGRKSRYLGARKSAFQALWTPSSSTSTRSEPPCEQKLHKTGRAGSRNIATGSPMPASRDAARQPLFQRSPTTSTLVLLRSATGTALCGERVRRCNGLEGQLRPTPEARGCGKVAARLTSARLGPLTTQGTVSRTGTATSKTSTAQSPGRESCARRRPAVGGWHYFLPQPPTGGPPEAARRIRVVARARAGLR
jgi:hypothetical protein